MLQDMTVSTAHGTNYPLLPLTIIAPLSIAEASNNDYHNDLYNKVHVNSEW